MCPRGCWQIGKDHYMSLDTGLFIVILTVLQQAQATPPKLLDGYHRSPWFAEQLHERWHEPGIRLIIYAPLNIDAAKPTRLVFFATPNGNTIEQTLGCQAIPGLDWHYDIQHIAAQTRRW